MIPNELIEIGKKDGFEISQHERLYVNTKKRWGICCLYPNERARFRLILDDSAALLLLGWLTKELNYKGASEILPGLTAMWLAEQEKK